MSSFMARSSSAHGAADETNGIGLRSETRPHHTLWWLLRSSGLLSREHRGCRMLRAPNRWAPLKLEGLDVHDLRRALRRHPDVAQHVPDLDRIDRMRSAGLLGL